MGSKNIFKKEWSLKTKKIVSGILIGFAILMGIYLIGWMLRSCLPIIIIPGY